MKWKGSFSYFAGDGAYVTASGQNDQTYVISGPHELFTETGIVMGYILTVSNYNDDYYAEETPHEEIAECLSVMDCMMVAEEHEVMYKMSV